MIAPWSAQAATLSIDGLWEWKSPLGELVQEFESRLPKPLPEGSRIELRTGGQLLNVIGTQDPDEYRILKGQFRVSSLSVRIDAESIGYIALSLFGGQQELAKALEAVYEAPPSKTRLRNSSTGEFTDSWVWKFPNFTVLLIPRENGQVQVSITRQLAPTGTSQTVAAGSVRKAAVDLDWLLHTTELWQCDVKAFEQRYVAKTEDEQKDPAQFEWLTAAKDRARFSRKMFANVETKLTMFAGSVKVEEATVEFVNGRVARATISFYNRGDSGEIGAKEFDGLYKKIGQGLGQVFKVNPKSQLLSSNAAVKTVGWVWTTPASVALLEYNEFGGTAKPEFLRLKLAAPNQADWSMGRLAVGVQRMALTKNITRSKTGDVYIAGVPMVDQGAKGYCVAASCQRLFEYMQIPCDQHEMAQLLNVDAERGANALEMQKSLAKVDSQFRVTFKPLVNPELYYDNKGKRRVSLKEFAGIVKEHADKGVPLLWALQLGLFKEEPPLPGEGQVSGGHMRMIIGYNSTTNKILFTDSWGAGHELKSMDATDAYQATLGLYSMSPRGL
ncbi:MAG TPA: hypothetical protein VD994_15460 [Prosthecobacter sp.]|nr:hypothetical protein [Prosthecobacter sp.]